MDYHICKDIGLKVEEMNEELSDHCSELLRQLKKMARERLICEYVGGSPLAFFQYFPYNAISETEIIETEEIALTQEASNGNRKGNENGKQWEKIVPKKGKDA